jgi:hypothetical protein
MALRNTYASIVTPGMALFAFIIILIVALLISGFCNPCKFDSTRTKIFISCLAGLGVFVTFLFYYSVVTLQQAQQRNDIINMTRNVNKNLKNMMEQIHEASKDIPHFILSLFPLLTIHTDKDKDNIENRLLKMKIAYKIFSLWQEIIIAVPFVDLDSHSFLYNFLQRASSQELHEIWCQMKFDFNEDTQKFGDLLFKHGLTIKNKTCEEYKKMAHQIHCDSLYMEIMKD